MLFALLTVLVILDNILFIFFWLMLGRIALAAISFGKQTVFTTLFRKLTFPVWWVVRRMMPEGVPDRHIPLLAVALLLTVRLLLRLIAEWLGGGSVPSAA